MKKLRKRDVLRKYSLQLLNHAHWTIRSIFRRRMRDAEAAYDTGYGRLDIRIPDSRRLSRDTWDIRDAQDDTTIDRRGKSYTFEDLIGQTSTQKSWKDFFITRVADPTSYFYKYHFDPIASETPQRCDIYLVDINWLKPHEEIVSSSRVAGLRRSIISWGRYTEPLLVDRATGAILDGHHRHMVGIQLQLKQLPVVLVDYLKDSTIEVDVWPNSTAFESLTKEQVIEMSLSSNNFPPKTSRHKFSDSLPPISIPLKTLRQEPRYKPTKIFATGRPQRRSSIQYFLDTTHSARNRVYHQIRSNRSKLDLVERQGFDASILFNRIRMNDPTSSFCQQHAVTLEDLLSNDRVAKHKFFATRVTDPTSFFYKYRLDTMKTRPIRRDTIELVDIKWLKPHEEIVSQDHLHGLYRATLRWNAYVDPLLVDVKTGAILDGHHRYNVGLLLGLKRIPAVLVDYLSDTSITVDVWPGCGYETLTKEQVIEKSLSDQVFPPKTSRHEFLYGLPPISVPLDELRHMGTSPHLI